MADILQTSVAYPVAESFDFTPEGYAKTCYWIPEDGFTWDSYNQQSFESIEEANAVLSKFKAVNAEKLEITKENYSKGSLRTLLPDRWLLAYSRNRAWRVVNDDKIPVYCQLKKSLYFKSIILGYGDGPINQLVPTREVAKYIKEQCASSARLKAIALRAYESVANVQGYHTWTTVSPPIFLCLAAMKSSLDAMSAVLWALLFHDLPKRTKRKTSSAEVFFPSMADLQSKLRENNHLFHDQFSKLYQSSWFTKLQDARDKVIHRSASPVFHDEYGAAFDFDLGLFRDSSPGMIHVGKPRVGIERNTKLLHLDKIVKNFVVGLEKWEASVSRNLAQLAWFPSYNTDGILLGIDFNDHELLRDGAGPSHLVASNRQGIRYKFSFVGLHPGLTVVDSSEKHH